MSKSIAKKLGINFDKGDMSIKTEAQLTELQKHTTGIGVGSSGFTIYFDDKTRIAYDFDGAMKYYEETMRPEYPMLGQAGSVGMSDGPIGTTMDVISIGNLAISLTNIAKLAVTKRVTFIAKKVAFNEEKFLLKIQSIEEIYKIRYEQLTQIKQTSTDLKELYDQPKLADEELKKLTEVIAKKTGGHPKFPPGLKKIERAPEKIDVDYSGDASRITDLSRSTIEFEELEDIYKALSKISDEYDIVRLKDRFKKPQLSGYRDILMNVKISNGHIVEMQLHLQAILEAKKIETELYNEIRSIKANLLRESRKPTVIEMAKIAELEKKSQELYQAALEKGMGK